MKFHSRQELENHIATSMSDNHSNEVAAKIAEGWLRDGSAVIVDEETGERIYSDTERLEWMMFNSAVVCHSTDAELCWVKYPEDDHWVETLNRFDNPRGAIDAAINGKVYDLY